MAEERKFEPVSPSSTFIGMWDDNRVAALRKGPVTFQGKPVDLSGPELKVGDAAPDFKLQGPDLADVTLAHSAGKVRIIASMPSVYTPVCSIETKKFNEEAARLANIDVLCVSMDLPFAQKQWCWTEKVERVHSLSDHRDASFGKAYGVLLTGGPLDHLLTRAIFVVGPDNKLRHVEYVAEITNEPNYQAAIAVAKR